MVLHQHAENYPREERNSFRDKYNILVIFDVVVFEEARRFGLLCLSRKKRKKKKKNREQRIYGALSCDLFGNESKSFGIKGPMEQRFRK